MCREFKAIKAINTLMAQELIAAVKARLAELDRLWEKEQTKADGGIFSLDQVFARLPTPPFTSEEKTVVAQSVYATCGSRRSTARLRAAPSLEGGKTMTRCH